MIQQAAIIGSGVMGHGIAQSYALAGYPIYMYDLKEEFLQKAIESVENNLYLLVNEGLITEEKKKEALANIHITTDLEAAVKESDIITEAIPEVLEMKWDLFAKLEQYAKPEAIIASNTSTLPISRLAEKSSSAHRMIITHFFNPAQLVPLVEIVKHEKTDDSVVELIMELMVKIGKTPILLKKEVPGFIANRLQAAIVREAFHLLKEGVADACDIDTAVTAGPGFRWAFIGPIETTDFGGLDTWKRVMDNLAPELDQSERAPEILNERVEKGNLGTKSGQGIYSYADISVAEKIKKRDENFIHLLKIKQGR
jgi:3-hydroxybutyryl-CoA dehydrogenase